MNPRQPSLIPAAPLVEVIEVHGSPGNDRQLSGEVSREDSGCAKDLRSPFGGSRDPKMKTFITFRSLARRADLPLTTAARRIRELEIIPDAITVELGQHAPVMLFDVERLPELRAILKNQPA